jgi:NAD(P)-dependent dehydrogenase (short-subunit alcohol dehydrogenase family)
MWRRRAQGAEFAPTSSIRASSIRRSAGRHTSAGRPSRSAAGVPFGRMATGWEIAYAALFFISDESVYVNAQALAVDSGISGL